MYNEKAIKKLNDVSNRRVSSITVPLSRCYFSFWKLLHIAVTKHKTLDHENVIKVYGMSQGFGYLPALILQSCENGNVTEYLKEMAESDRKNRTRERLVSERV